MVKVFFGCTIRGEQKVVSRDELARFLEIIEALGYKLMSKHQTETGVKEKENQFTNTAVHDRDYLWEIGADFGVFEISNASLGVGGEISDMINMGKPVLTLFKKGLETEVSKYTQGKMGSKYVNVPFECYAYQTLADAQNKIKEFKEKYVQTEN